VNYKKIS